MPVNDPPVNLVVLHGHLSSVPKVRSLPSGSTLVQLEVTTPAVGSGAAVGAPAAACSVPVAWFDPPARSGLDPDTPVDTEVVVVGHVRRRWFRAGGVTQSRTEVVADTVVPARRARGVARVRARVLATLAAECDPPT